MIKVQLIVVQGKPEGKTIPLTVPTFQIGRDPTCHLRPSSDQVSRKHAEISITSDAVILKDLGSRNGTQLNGRTLASPARLKSGDLIKIGHLTFAVSIQGAPAATQAPSGRPMATVPTSLDEVPQEEVESWLIADHERPVPDRPSGVYDGDTITINAYKETQAGAKTPTSRELPTIPKTEKASPKPPSSREMSTAAPVQPPASKPASREIPVATASPSPVVPAANPEPPRKPAQPPAEKEENEAGLPSYLQGLTFDEVPVAEGAPEPAAPEQAANEGAAELESEEETSGEPALDDLIDESNPFYAARKQAAAAAAPAESKKVSYKDSSDAAKDILNRMLERRRNR